MKAYSIQMLGNDGRWFYLCGAMWEHTAQYWFKKYCGMYPSSSIRLCYGENGRDTGTVHTLKTGSK